MLSLSAGGAASDVPVPLPRPLCQLATSSLGTTCCCCHHLETSCWGSDAPPEETVGRQLDVAGVHPPLLRHRPHGSGGSCHRVCAFPRPATRSPVEPVTLYPPQPHLGGQRHVPQQAQSPTPLSHFWGSHSLRCLGGSQRAVRSRCCCCFDCCSLQGLGAAQQID